MEAIENIHENEHKFPIAVVYNGATKHESVARDEKIKEVLARAIQIFHVTFSAHQNVPGCALENLTIDRITIVRTKLRDGVGAQGAR